MSTVSSTHLRRLNASYLNELDDLLTKPELFVKRFVNKVHNHLNCTMEEDSDKTLIDNPQKYLTNMAEVGCQWISVFQGHVPQGTEGLLREPLEDFMVNYFNLKSFKGFRLEFKHHNYHYLTTIKLVWNTPDETGRPHRPEYEPIVLDATLSSSRCDRDRERGRSRERGRDSGKRGKSSHRGRSRRRRTSRSSTPPPTVTTVVHPIQSATGAPQKGITTMTNELKKEFRRELRKVRHEMVDHSVGKQPSPRQIVTMNTGTKKAMDEMRQTMLQIQHQLANKPPEQLMIPPKKRDELKSVEFLRVDDEIETTAHEVDVFTDGPTIITDHSHPLDHMSGSTSTDEEESSKSVINAFDEEFTPEINLNHRKNKTTYKRTDEDLPPDHS
jgi:hypothetical protein